jgi:signal transduction histidine kinase
MTAETSPSAALAAAGQRILIVDDDQEFAESIADILVPSGYEAVIADRAETAAAMLQSLEPRVAMLDIRLGRSSGVDLLTRLRTQRPELICVMMTAHADTQTAIAAMRQGAYDYFDKSAEPAELLAVLDRCFEKSRLQQENRRAYDALRIAKEAAEKANHAKSEFLANISHELRTPLNAIIGFSEVMMRGILGPVGNDSYLGYLKDIHDSGIDLLNIINDILDLSKAEAGKLELSEQTVDVATVLEAVCRLMTNKIESAGLIVETRLAPKLSLLFCDRLKLKQVLLNLLSNAVKFSPQGGRIAITASSDAETGFTIAIQDNGIGIAKDDIPRVLLPFEQVESSLSRSHNGTGLGLPLSAAMMMLHGGTLAIDSEIDKGTTVTVAFPRARLVDAWEEGGAEALTLAVAAAPDAETQPARYGYG